MNRSSLRSFGALAASVGLAAVSACTPRGTFLRADGAPAEFTGAPRNAPPEVFLAGIEGAASPMTLVGGPPITVVGLVSVQGSEGGAVEPALKEALKQGQAAGCEVLIDFASYAPRLPSGSGRTMWSGEVIWQFLCGLRAADAAAPAATLPFPDFVEAWAGANQDSGRIGCERQAGAPSRTSRIACIYRTKGTGVQNEMCSRCSAGYVNELERAGIPLKVKWANHPQFPGVDG
jgi:hypothetical protein